MAISSALANESGRGLLMQDFDRMIDLELFLIIFGFCFTRFVLFRKIFAALYRSKVRSAPIAGEHCS